MMWQKFISLVVVFSILSNTVYAQRYSGIHFEEGLNWQEVQALAKAGNKYIFVDCYASWCGPCKEMDKTIYVDGKVGDYFNSKFISIRVQMDSTGQDNVQTRGWYEPAAEFAKKYRILQYPTFLFFSPEGKVLHKEIGFKGAEDLILAGSNAMDSDRQYYTLLNKYDSRKLDSGYFKLLARMANDLGQKVVAHEIANSYIELLREDELYTPDNIEFLVGFTKSTTDRGFLIFRDHGDKVFEIDNRINKEESKEILQNIIYTEEIKPFTKTKNGKPDWNRIEKNVKVFGELGLETYTAYKPGLIFKAEIEPIMKQDPDWGRVFQLIKVQHAGKGQEFLVGSSIVYYLNAGLASGQSHDTKNFMAAARYYFKNYYSYLSAGSLNTWAWTIFKQSSDATELTTALVWSDSSMVKNGEPNAGFMDTYANLLYRLGRNNEALPREEKAVLLAPDDTAIQEALRKMKSGEPTWNSN